MGHLDEPDLIPLRPPFDIVRRGYDRAQVHDRLDELQAELNIVMADNEAGAAQFAELAKQLEAVRQELDEARRELHRLSAPPDTVEGMSERLKRMVKLAKDEAAEVAARAEAAAANRMAEAERNAGDVRARYERLIGETQRRRSEMEAEHEAVIAQARQRAEELAAEAATRRKQVEEDFDITMSARRGETMRALADEEARSKAEAERRVSEATEVARRVVTEADQRATAMVGDATRRVDALRTVRHQVAEQLLSVRSTLDNAFQHLNPLHDEDSTLAGAGAHPAGRHRDHASTSPRLPS